MHLRALPLIALATACGPTTAPDDAPGTPSTDLPDGATDVPDTDLPDTDPAAYAPLPDLDTDGDACDSRATPHGDDPSPAWGCAVGTGITAFEPLCPGDALTVTRGPQGGWHVWGGLACTGIKPGDRLDPRSPTNPVITWLLYDPASDCLDGGLCLGGYRALPRALVRGKPATLVGELVVFWGGTYEDAVDRDARMFFELTDADGKRMSRDLPVRLIEEPPFVPDTDGDTDSDSDSDGAVVP